MNIKHLIQFSGGIASAYSAKLVLDRFSRDETAIVFADTKMEDEDLYRFVDDMERVLCHPIIRLADGRTPWQVFFDVRFLGNSRVDPCSKILKRELLAKWKRDNAPSAINYVGIWWDEKHRLDNLNNHPKNTQAWDSPLLWDGWHYQRDAFDWLEAVGVERPRLYRLGFPHNNCGGFCVKAGQVEFRRLLMTMPDRYRFHEQQEELIREKLGDVSILSDRRGGKSKRITSRQFRERIQSDASLFDECDTMGSCGCALDNMEAA